MSTLTEMFNATRDASQAVRELDDATRNALLRTLADRMLMQADSLLEANAADLAAMDSANPLYDRLMLTPERLAGASGVG